MVKAEAAAGVPELEQAKAAAAAVPWQPWSAIFFSGEKAPNIRENHLQIRGSSGDFQGKIISACWNDVEFHGHIYLQMGLHEREI